MSETHVSSSLFIPLLTPPGPTTRIELRINHIVPDRLKDFETEQRRSMLSVQKARGYNSLRVVGPQNLNVRTTHFLHFCRIHGFSLIEAEAIQEQKRRRPRPVDVLRLVLSKIGKPVPTRFSAAAEFALDQNWGSCALLYHQTQERLYIVLANPAKEAYPNLEVQL